VIVLSILPSMPDFIERLRSPKNLFDKTHPHAVICCMIYSDTINKIRNLIFFNEYNVNRNN